MVKKWSEQEIKILKELWNNPNISLNDILKVLTGRTYEAIKWKARNLKLGSKKHHIKIDFEYLRKLGIVVSG